MDQVLPTRVARRIRSACADLEDSTAPVRFGRRGTSGSAPHLQDDTVFHASCEIAISRLVNIPEIAYHGQSFGAGITEGPRSFVEKVVSLHILSSWAK